MCWCCDGKDADDARGEIERKDQEKELFVASTIE